MGGVRAAFEAFAVGTVAAQLVPDGSAVGARSIALATAGLGAIAAIVAVGTCRRAGGLGGPATAGTRPGTFFASGTSDAGGAPHASGASAVPGARAAVGTARAEEPRDAARSRDAVLALLAVGVAALAGASLGRWCLEAAGEVGDLPATHVARLELPRRVRLVGRVAGLPTRQAGRTVALLDAARVDGRPASGRVRLTVRGRVAKLRPGDEVAVSVTLRRPRGFANPGSFDVAGHLARRDVRVTSTVWDADRVSRRSRPARGSADRLARWRQRLVRAIGRAAPGPDGAVLSALIVGDQARVPVSVREAFARAGVVHVLSVSGLHVGIVALVSVAVLRWLLGRSVRVLQTVDVRAIAAAASIPPVAGYALLAGLEVATARAAVMAAVAAVAVCAGRRVDVRRTLAVAAVALALAWPGSPREIGFQLSFASVLSIVLATARYAPGPPRGIAGRMRLAAVVATAATLGTTPLTARHFQQVSLIAPFANPLVIPLFGVVVVVVGLGAAVLEPAMPGVAQRGFALAAWLVRPGLRSVEVLAAPELAAIRVPTPDALELTLLLMLLLASVLRAARARRMVAILATLGLGLDAASWWHVRHGNGRLRVTFLDVGQGDASVVELPDGGVLVVDAGGFPGSDFDTGRAVVAPFLATRKIVHLDALVATHAHPDHFAGLPALLPWAREIWWAGHAGTGAEWQRLRATAAPVAWRLVTAGAALPPMARGVVALHPPAGWDPPTTNDASLVLAIQHGAVTVLLTGDAERASEAAMLRAGTAWRADVLKVPHHGSRTSSTPAFVDAVAPSVAVVSVGADNRYRLPAPEVEARYGARHTCVLRTDRCGAVTLDTDGITFTVSTHAGCRCPAAAIMPPG